MYKKIIIITGSRKGIGRYLSEYYTQQGYYVIGCSREKTDYKHNRYLHFCLDIVDEVSVKKMFMEIRKLYGQVDVLVNNAGVASMNHSLLTPLSTVQKVLNTNISGTFLFCRESAKLMKAKKYGRIINFASVAVPLKLDGESIYAASKAAVITLTQILAKEYADFGITVNAVGPTPIETDLIKAVPREKIKDLIERQSIKRMGNYQDISNVIDFYINRESSFITGQTIYLGGI